VTSSPPKPIDDLGVDADLAIAALEVRLDEAQVALAAVEEAIDRVGGGGDTVVARVLVGLRAAVDQFASVPGADSPLSQLRLKFAASRELLNRRRARGADGG
jgi:hypothetical protein